MNDTERDDLKGKILLEENKVQKELQAYLVKIEKARERLMDIGSRLGNLVSALDPAATLTSEAGRYASWAGVDLAQTSEDCQKALHLRQNLDNVRIQKTRLDL